MANVDIHLEILAKSMSLRLKRHSTLAGNVANADTPGYRPQQISFEDALQRAADRKSSVQIDNVKSSMEVVDDGQPRLDGNTVNLDKQMAMMAENGLLYNATAEFIARKMRMLKSVIG